MKNTATKLPQDPGTGHLKANGPAMHVERLSRCRWCNELFPKGELRQETDLGPLCGRCIAAIRSRGETLTLKD